MNATCVLRASIHCSSSSLVMDVLRPESFNILRTTLESISEDLLHVSGMTSCTLQVGFRRKAASSLCVEKVENTLPCKHFELVDRFLKNSRPVIEGLTE